MNKNKIKKSFKLNSTTTTTKMRWNRRTETWRGIEMILILWIGL